MSPDIRKLRGTLTALVTPMNRDGSIDFGALDALVDTQIESGINGLVPCGSTGEAATMTAIEREQIITRVVKKVAGRVVVIAGAGGMGTLEAIDNQKRAAGSGAACALVATPAYNRPTPEGLYRHYAALLDAVDFPTMLYNVPSRTGTDMLPATVGRIAALSGIVGIKEATGDLDRVAAIRALTPPEFLHFSGDDPSACAYVLLGGHGVISVASNFAPKLMASMIRAALDGKVEIARSEHRELRPLFAAMALQSNPLPVKAALAMRGTIQEYYRLPLCEMNQEPRARLEEILRQNGWLS
ncbi:MAG: 4-hydroxy-tetrahydrodipicolinate synthase [Deltaproteobacteria bacterium RIFOXYB12_FULL_58_9]|nr:MAG: 4-hydroxy-tetrahydrodipicolinate synthase [Deltaproteobacteria bacterium RIFOXYB12_FULL_58_9]